jgi:hypothetical protein
MSDTPHRRSSDCGRSGQEPHWSQRLRQENRRRVEAIRRLGARSPGVGCSWGQSWVQMYSTSTVGSRSDRIWAEPHPDGSTQVPDRGGGGLSGRADPEHADAPHVQPHAVVVVAREPEHDVVTIRTAHDHARGVGIDAQRADHAHRPAAFTRAPRRRDLEGEHVVEQPPSALPSSVRSFMASPWVRTAPS